MINLICTNAVLKHIRLRKDDLKAVVSTTAVLGNWYVNVFPIEARIAFLYMSEKSFLSFILMEGKKVDAARLSGAFLGGLSQVLAIEGFRDSTIERVISDYELGLFAHSKSASDLGSLTSLMLDYRAAIAYDGGLKRCDIGSIIKVVNRLPNKRLGWQTPIGKTEALVNAAAI